MKSKQKRPGKTTYVLRGGKLVPARTTIPKALMEAPWPRWSLNLGGPPKKQAELRALYEKHGIQAEFDKKGRVKVMDRNQNKRMAEARGMIDYGAGLSGDAQPKYEHYEMLREQEAETRFMEEVNAKVAEYERQGFHL